MALITTVLLAPGLLAARPAFGQAGRVYFATDAQTLTYDTGAAWVAYAPVGGGDWTFVQETIVAGAAAASIVLAAIPGTYRDLAVVLRTFDVGAYEGVSLFCQMNADGGNNYDWLIHAGQGAAASVVAVSRATTAIACGQGEGANSRANNRGGTALMYFPDYKNTNFEKWLLTTVAAGFGDVSADNDMTGGHYIGRWRNTAAITQLTFTSGANIDIGSYAALYGVG